MKYIGRLLIIIIFGHPVYAQVSQVEFGKNRVQYHQDFEQWLSYESQNFVTYWYGMSSNVGKKSAQLAESIYDEIISTIEYRINDKIELIVYADVTDVKMTNIGSEEILMGRAGRTTIERNKVFVYFDGDHRNLQRQIREGVAGVFINYMLYGTEIQEIVQNMTALGLPEWFNEGLVAFVGDYWAIGPDNDLRDALSSKNFKDFNRFAREHPRTAGHAFWLYIALNFGKSEIGNLLYYIRINRNLENAFLFILGIPYEELLERTWFFMKDLSVQEPALLDAFETLQPLPIKNKKGIPYTDVKINPTAPYIAYTWNNQGKVRTYLYDLRDGKKKKLMQIGYRNTLQETDYNYPILSWHPDGKSLAIIYEKRAKVYLMIYDLQTQKSTRQLIPNRYQRIYSMDWWTDNTLVFSASEANFTDLYLYRIRTRSSTQLTDDIFDDHNVTVGYMGDTKGIFFSSNRTTLQTQKVDADTIVPLSEMNIYFLNPESKSDSVTRVTNTSGVDHTHLNYLSNGDIHFLSDEFGIINRASITPGENEITYLTDYPRNIVNFDVNYSKQMTAEIIQYRGVPSIYIRDLSDQKAVNPKPTTFFELYRGTVSRRVKPKSRGRLTSSKPSITAPVQRDTIKESNPDYFFQSPFGDMKIQKPEKSEKEDSVADALTPKPKKEEDKQPDPKFEKVNVMRISPYRLKFRLDYVNTTMDNNPLFEGLEAYAGTGEVVFNNPFGLLFKANVKDLMEDYQIEGGIRIPTTFNGAEYFLFFDDRKKRLNKRYAIYRRANYNTEGFLGNVILRNRQEILLGQYQLRYPIDVFTSVRAIATLRQDRFNRLATEPISLMEPPVVEQRAGLRLEYVFDNTMPIDLNILSGTRYKVFGEVVKRFDIQFLDDFNFNLGEGLMTIIGFDARHYIQLLRHSVFAVRAAGATSFGSEKILYLLGGSDNTIVPNFNDNIPLPPGDEFALQTLAPSVRGFDPGIRNGSSFALVNAELRIPIFKYLYNRPIRSNFIRHFQVVGFADAGTAWQGRSPFDVNNPINTLEIENNSIFVRVNYFRDPIVMGYGVGIRTMIFGYFARVDYAWGFETKTLLRPRFHFSLGVDF